MTFKHTRTGGLYRVLFNSFSVERQAHSVVYVSLETGQIFDRDDEKFAENFTLHQASPQAKIVPKAPHA